MDAGDARAVAALMGAAGTSGFGDALDALARRQASFDMSVLLVYSPKTRPTLLHDGYTDRISRAALDAYLEASYLVDPFYVASIGGHRHGLWRMRDLAPDSFFVSGFMTSPDVHPCISAEARSLAEEIGFILPVESGLTATYSLMRLSPGRGFTNGEVDALRSIEPILGEAIRSHWSAQRRATRYVHVMEDMEARFASLFRDTLTSTQREVVQLLLRGHSALSIAMTMNISEGTAKNHRANIYKRLKISSQSELFRLFIDHLNDAGVSRPAARSGLHA